MKRKQLFTAFVLVLLLTVAMVLVVPTAAVAEPNSSDSSAVQVINVQDYLDADSQTDVAWQQELYDVLGFSSEQDITALEKEMLASAELAQVGRQTYRLAFGKSITITSRLYRIPSLDQEKEKGYFVSLTAEWTGMPLYRMKDMLVFSTANNVVYGANRYLDYTFYSATYSGGKTQIVEHHYNWKDSYTEVLQKQMVSEWPGGVYLYGMKVKLPSDICTKDVQVQYYNPKIRLQTTIYTDKEFTFHTAYGHHYLLGDTDVSSNGGTLLQFDRNTKVYLGKELSTLGFRE